MDNTRNQSMINKKEELKRVELIFIQYNKISDLNIDFKNGNIGSIYIRVDIETISFTREFLVNNGYSTRLIVVPNIDNIFYIYGRKKANKAVFNEHCKNTVIRNNNYIEHLINVSSNEYDTVLTDFDKVLSENMNREWLKYA